LSISPRSSVTDTFSRAGAVAFLTIGSISYPNPTHPEGALEKGP
jgi:hypothetical protein